MSTPAILFGLFALVFGAAAIPGARTRHAAAFCGALLFVAAAILSSMGQPKPLWSEWRTTAGARLLMVSFDEPHTIYVWIMQPGERVPVAYALPWSKKAAQEALQAMEAAKSGGAARMGGARSGKGGQNGNGAGQGGAGDRHASGHVFYADPPSPLPPKTTK